MMTASVDTTRPQRKRATKEYLEKRSGERNVDSRIQVQLEEDGGGRTRQSWICQWSVAYVLLAVTRHKSKVSQSLTFLTLTVATIENWLV